MGQEFELIIDTNQYAGNFERELCAYVTGKWDNETHGGDQAAVFENEVLGDPFEEFVRFETNEFGLESPQQICETPSSVIPHKKHPGTDMLSVGIFLVKELPPDLLQLLKERARKFCKDGLIFGKPVEGAKLCILGFRLLTREITETVESI